MKVKELIEELQKCNLENKVFICFEYEEYGGGSNYIGSEEIISVTEYNGIVELM